MRKSLPAEISDPFGARADRKMPFLKEALDPAVAQGRLEQCWLAAPGPGGSLELLALRVVRYKPERRCLIEYDVQVPGRGNFTLLGKARTRGVDQRTCQLMRKLRAAGFDDHSGHGVSVPEPLGAIPEFGMWVQRKVNGTPATGMLMKPAGIELARRIAVALRILHGAGIPAVREHSMQEELRILSERLAQVAEMRPGWRSRLDALLGKCRDRASELPAPARCGIHRDFYPAQVLVDGPRLWLLDFDLYTQGDRALDAGNFLAHLTEQGLRELGSTEAMRPQEEAFEDAFVDQQGDDLHAAVRLYRHLSLARHIWISTQFADRQSVTNALLNLCEQEAERH